MSNKEILLDFLKKNNWRSNNGTDIQFYFQQLKIFLKIVEIRGLIKELRGAGHFIFANKTGYRLLDLSKEIDRKLASEYIENRRLELRSESIVINTLQAKLTEYTMGVNNGN